MSVDPIRCVDVVELLTDYLDGALDPRTAAAIEEHLAACPPCRVYLDQLRATIALVGQVANGTLPSDTVPADSLPPSAVAELESAFAGVHRRDPSRDG
ncbi:MAG: anti-sigma factor family protein [Jatrophihabitantaceae bacterium]